MSSSSMIMRYELQLYGHSTTYFRDFTDELRTDVTDINVSKGPS